MRNYRTFSALFAFTLFAAIVCATTVKPMSVQELTEASTNIVQARALSAHSEWDAGHTLIYTYTRFRVVNTLKGQSATEFVVRQLGGHADGYTQKVSGVRQWAPGQEVVLFLRPSEASGAFAVIGLFQGNFAITRSAKGETLVSNGVSGVSSLQRGTVKTFHGEQLTLRQLQQSVISASGGLK